MHKASDLGTNIYKIGADRNSLNFDFMLLHFFPTSPKEEFDFYERRNRAVLSTNHYATGPRNDIVKTSVSTAYIQPLFERLVTTL